MDSILEMAGQLGRLIGKDPRAAKLADARKGLADSLEDRQLLADYETHQRKLYELESQGAPVEPDDKRAMADLHGKVVGSEVLKKLLSAQADYIELMTGVSARIEQEALGLRKPADE